MGDAESHSAGIPIMVTAADADRALEKRQTLNVPCILSHLILTATP